MLPVYVCPVCGAGFEANYPGRVCCSAVCRDKKRGSFEDRFWARVNKTEKCWEWTGKLDRTGYARVKRENKKEKVLVHRTSWEMHNGPIPDGVLVLHHCDNRKCVNPDHLYLGDHKDNSRDMFDRGRANKAQGEKHGRAKLSDASAMELLQRYRAGGVTQPELAKEYGLHPVYVNKLIKGRRRKHLQPEG